MSFHLHLHLPWFFKPLNIPKPSWLSKAKTLISTIIKAISPPKRNSTNAQKPTSRNGHRRPSDGSSRRSALKRTFTQEQVTFAAPISSDRMRWFGEREGSSPPFLTWFVVCLVSWRFLLYFCVFYVDYVCIWWEHMLVWW